MKNRQAKKIIVVCPNSFKGCMSAKEASGHITLGARDVFPESEIRLLPIADGGEGTLEAIVEARGGVRRVADVCGPLGTRVSAAYGVIDGGETVVMEMASAAGLPLVAKAKRNPMLTSTYGVGELILRALKESPRQIIIGVGGSATVDFGIGMAQALGYRFFNKDGDAIPLFASGKDLIRVSKIEIADTGNLLGKTRIIVASDVRNPLCGRNGAAYIFAPQKGATAEQVAALDEGMRYFSGVLERGIPGLRERLDGARLCEMESGGAAGGLGAGLFAFLGAEIKPGAELIFDIMKFEEALAGADLVITGEGATDEQTFMGKAPGEAARLAKLNKIAAVMITGNASRAPDISFLRQNGVCCVMPIAAAPASEKEMIKSAGEALRRTAAHVVSVFFGNR